MRLHTHIIAVTRDPYLGRDVVGEPRQARGGGSRHGCGRGEPSREPSFGADMGGASPVASPVSAQMWEGRAQSRRGCWTLEVQYCSAQARRACVCWARAPSAHSCVRAIRFTRIASKRVPEGDLLGLRCRLDDELRVSADLRACSRMAHAMQRRTQAHLVGQHIHDKHVPSRL